MTMSTPESQTLQKLRHLHEQLVYEVREPLEVPEPSLRLNVATRAGDDGRMVRHLHQSCWLHSINFRWTTRYKLPYLTEEYLTTAERGSLFGLYSSARALVEFSAFTHEVANRLGDVCAKRDGHWRGRGEEFFALIVRARYGTSDPKTRDILIKEGGISKRHLEPFRIMECVKNLAKHPDFQDVISEYDQLCDFVHHNASSQIAVNAGFHLSQVARSPRGGALVMRKPGPVLRYEYPATEKIRKAVLATAPIALRHAEAIVRWMNECPESPSTVDELEHLTGNPMGMGAPGSVHIPNDVLLSSSLPKVGRNDPCPCGSEKKFKHCHGRA